MLNLNQKQLETLSKIEAFTKLFSLPDMWPAGIAMTESSLGLNQKSPTGCKGVFQMSGIAMKDLLQEMEKADDDLIDIACGVAFLYLLYKRHSSIENATGHFCDPADRDFYIKRVLDYMGELK
jgi:hypothetical protein